MHLSLPLRLHAATSINMLEKAPVGSLPEMYRQRWQSAENDAADSPFSSQFAVREEFEDNAPDTGCVLIYDDEEAVKESVCGELSFDSTDDGMVRIVPRRTRPRSSLFAVCDLPHLGVGVTSQRVHHQNVRRSVSCTMANRYAPRPEQSLEAGTVYVSKCVCASHATGRDKPCASRAAAGEPGLPWRKVAQRICRYGFMTFFYLNLY